MGKMIEADNLTVGILYSGAGVFLVLMGIFFLTRFGSPSGDEGMAREGNRVMETRPKDDKRPENRPRDNRPREDRRPVNKQVRSRTDQDEWLRKQKEDLKFQKETLEKAVEKEISGETGERPRSHVTVKPAPTRPRGRRR
jgi:hypothetical protein